MTTNQLVKDYRGALVSKAKARKIKVGGEYKYYVEGVSCFLMDDGQWYRIDSPKIAYDNYKKKYVLLATTNMIEGIINEKGDRGAFSENSETVDICKRSTKGAPFDTVMTASLAEKMGYEECIADGLFYLSKEITADDRKSWFCKKDIPKHERSTSYNLEQDPDKKARLIEQYEKADFPISMAARKIGRLLGRYTIGMENEVINGFVPRRIRDKYGLKALKDGSLRSDHGEGIEYVTMPMQGAKCIQTIIDVMKEFAKRCEVNNYCSLHFHCGNVRKDKLYVLSFYKLISHLQPELKGYFPYSRFQSIKPDGKIYCKPLENLNIQYQLILNSKTEDEFKSRVVTEFNKLYSWLNGGKSLAEEFGTPTVERRTKVIDGKKMFCDVWLKNVYSTKTIHHSLHGQKWDKPVRYYIVNFLNLFFNSIGTIEFRCHESTTSPTKAIIWLLTCVAMLNYAEHINLVFKAANITLRSVLEMSFDRELVDYIMSYMKLRRETFFTASGAYRQNYANIEGNWFAQDPKFTFESKNYKLI